MRHAPIQSESHLSPRLGNGDGTFLQASSNFNPVDSFHSGLIARDLDLDSRHDLVATSFMGQTAIVALNASATANCPPPGADRVQAKIFQRHAHN